MTVSLSQPGAFAGERRGEPVIAVSRAHHVNPDHLAVLARELAAEQDVTALLTRVVNASVSQIDGAEHAGITMLGHKSVTTPVATSALVFEIDQHQYATGEGPCLTAALEQQPVIRADDLRTDQRWPEFTAAVSPLGVRSMLSFQLFTSTDTIGALNVYAAPAQAFSDDSVHIGVLLAAHAAVAASAAAQVTNLRTALDSRDTIGQGKGILMERYKITADQAFDLLITTSTLTNRKLRDIATDLAETGEFSAT